MRASFLSLSLARPSLSLALSHSCSLRGGPIEFLEHRLIGQRRHAYLRGNIARSPRSLGSHRPITDGENSDAHAISNWMHLSRVSHDRRRYDMAETSIHRRPVGLSFRPRVQPGETHSRPRRLTPRIRDRTRGRHPVGLRLTKRTLSVHVWALVLV